MKYFSMANPINEELLEKFLGFYNQYQSEPCKIILNTRGGSTYISDIFISMINEMPDVTLLIHAAYSSGFEIAYNAKCKKQLSKTARGMYHLGKADMSLAIDSKPYYDEDINHAKGFVVEMKASNMLAKKVMTKAEFNSYKVKRDEVWFDFKRMKQIFPDAKILK